MSGSAPDTTSKSPDGLTSVTVGGWLAATVSTTGTEVDVAPLSSVATAVSVTVPGAKDVAAEYGVAVSVARRALLLPSWT